MTASTMKKTAAGLCLAGLLLLFALAMAYQSAQWSLENSLWVSHTREVLGALDATQADLAQSRTAIRLYLIDERTSSLRNYHDHLSRLDVELGHVAQLTADNPTQQSYLATLRAQIRELVEAWGPRIASLQKSANRQSTITGSNQKLADAVSATIGSMKDEERGLLKARQAQLHRSSHYAKIAFGTTVGFEFLLFGLIYYAIRKELKTRGETEHALRESEERFRLLVSSVTDYAIYRLTPDGRIATWNEGAERIKGYTGQEIIGKHFSCFYTPDDLADGKPGRELEMATAQGNYQEEGWRVRKDGTRFWASVVITALRDDAGDVRGFSKITRDVTQRRRSEALLQESEERHRILFENNPLPTWVYDRETLKFLAVNAAAVRKYGYSTGEFLTMTIKDIRPPEEISAVLASVARLTEGKESSGEWQHRLKDGSLIDVELTSFSLNFEGRPAQVAVAVDITQRKKSEQERQRFTDALARANEELELRSREAEHATALKSKFLANMSHELRTPLNAIVGFSGLLADGTAGPLNDKQKRFVSHIKNGSGHLLQLINDILDLSKIEAGQMEIRPASFYVHEALPEVLSTIRPLAMAKNVRLRHRSETRLAVVADRVRFKQILYNLLSNGVKFTPANGEVAIEWFEEKGFICVSVADTGIGISAEDQELIFEEFRQVAGEEAHQGTGLGLTITKRLIQQMGGRIWLESRVGEGSRFSFTLPAGTHVDARIAIDTELTSAENTGNRPRARGEEPLILIIDDEAPARELLASYLEPEGYRTQTAISAADAIQKAKSLQPDAITLDILMPNANGFEILLALKASPQTVNIPIIVVSIVDQQKVGFALGAADYLIKPVNKTILLDRIRKYTQSQRAKETRILVVDDDLATLDLLNEMLRSAGYTTHTASSGEGALGLLANTVVDAILLDLLMPAMDGFEVLRRLKEDSRLQEVPVFILTAKNLTESDVELLRRETQALFHKDGPWREELLKALGKAISAHRPAGLAGTT